MGTVALDRRRVEAHFLMRSIQVIYPDVLELENWGSAIVVFIDITITQWHLCMDEN